LQLARLWRGAHPALAVRTLVDERGDIHVLAVAAEEAVPFPAARAPLAGPKPNAPPTGEVPVRPVPAVLLGTLRDRGWVLLLTEAGVLVPIAPLSVFRTDVPPGSGRRGAVARAVGFRTGPRGYGGGSAPPVL
jgi:hypothetical protein